MQSYSQIRAMLAITKASLKATFRSPSAVIFSFVFPFVFILVFGFIGSNSGGPVFKIAINKKCDTLNLLYDSIKASKRIKIMRYNDEKELRSDLIKGKIAGVLQIKRDTTLVPNFSYTLTATTASNDKWPQLLPLLGNIVNGISNSLYVNRPTYAALDFVASRAIETVREYNTIDFILSGMVGFSLPSSRGFGVAFMLFSLRNTLVLKRFFATPISRTYIVLGEGLARVIFQIVTAYHHLGAVRFVFGFTLNNGVFTLLQMLFVSFIGLVVFMGLGFIVSGLAKTESTIPPIANLLTLPQFLIGGTFFSVEVFPKWLQPISNALPLTHLNAAMRAVAFEGQSLWDVKSEIGILLLWGVIVYTVAIKVFKWE